MRIPVLTPVQMVQEWKHANPLIGCRFDPSGRFLFASAQDNTLQRWDLATGKQTALVGHKSWVRGLAFHPREPFLFSGDYAGRVMSWRSDTATPQPGMTLDAHRGWVRAIAVSPDGKYLASAGNDHLVKLWSCPDGKLLRELAGHASHVYNVAFHPNGKHLASADLKGNVQHWSIDAERPLRELDAHLLNRYDTVFGADIGGARSMAFSADGGLLACAGITEVTNAFAGVGKPAIVVLDWADGKRKPTLLPKDDFQGTAWGVAFHPLGFVIGVGGGRGGALWIWKLDQPQPFFTLKLPMNARDLSLHPDGERLAVAFADGAVRVYRLRLRDATDVKAAPSTSKG